MCSRLSGSHIMPHISNDYNLWHKLNGKTTLQLVDVLQTKLRMAARTLKCVFLAKPPLVHGPSRSLTVIAPRW